MPTWEGLHVALVLTVGVYNTLDESPLGQVLARFEKHASYYKLRIHNAFEGDLGPRPYFSTSQFTKSAKLWPIYRGRLCLKVWFVRRTSFLAMEQVAILLFKQPSSDMNIGFLSLCFKEMDYKIGALHTSPQPMREQL
eukprot:scaffold271_cov336-Pavlova_lutheri.AAC.55